MNVSFQLMYAKVQCELLRVLYKSVFRFVGAKAFKITYDKAIVELTTKESAIIPKEQFSNVIEQFSSCGCFCVHLKIEGMDDSAIVTPHVSPILFHVNKR